MALLSRWRAIAAG